MQPLTYAGYSAPAPYARQLPGTSLQPRCYQPVPRLYSISAQPSVPLLINLGDGLYEVWLSFCAGHLFPSLLLHIVLCTVSCCAEPDYSPPIRSPSSLQHQLLDAKGNTLLIVT